jgi:hypothetical protein
MKSSFESLMNKSSASFHAQKAQLKKLMLGKPVNCPVCNQALAYQISHDYIHVFCPKNCTDLQLEL